MTNMAEEGRQAAHVLLDMVSVFDADHPEDDASVKAMNLALDRLNDVDAVTATQDDETGELIVTVSNLVGGAAVAMQWLITQLAHSAGESPLDVIVKAREFLDRDDG